MEILTGGLSPAAFAATVAVTIGAAFVKGAVGFAMPMIMISALASFLPYETALAVLVMPTLVTNLAQSLRDGPAAAWGSVMDYRRLILATVVMLVLTAQFVPAVPQALLLGLLGGPVALYALLLLAGVPLRLPLRDRARWQWGLGALGGFFGGFSGVWGPPLLVYLVSAGVPKQETVRVQGVVFLIGAVALLFAHLASGLLTPARLGLSTVMALPAMLGLWAGFRVQDRLDQAAFRRWTLILLLLTGLNLLRRAVAG